MFESMTFDQIIHHVSLKSVIDMTEGERAQNIDDSSLAEDRWPPRLP